MARATLVRCVLSVFVICCFCFVFVLFLFWFFLGGEVVLLLFFWGGLVSAIDALDLVRKTKWEF